MSVLKTMLTFLLLVNLGCASERLYVRVIDDEGRPVPSATVNVDFTLVKMVRPFYMGAILIR